MMKAVRYLMAAAGALTVLASVSTTSALPTPYFQCVRAVEVSCGFPYPADIDAYNQCVAEGIALNCAGLPGDPGFPG